MVRVTRVAIGPGDRRSLPDDGIPGRRFVGIIESAGRSGSGGQANAMARGTRVVVKPLIRCGTCDLCKGGLGDHCRNRVTIGSDERDGCLADLIAVPTENLVPLPDNVDDDAGVFAWTLAGAMHVAHMMRVDGRAFVTVLGDDAMGLMCAQWLASQNTSVRLLGLDAARFGLCERWGVKHRHADDVGRRADQDVVIDCTNSVDGLELAMRLVRPRGTILLRGTAPAGVDLAPIADGELTLMGSRAGNLREAVTALASGQVDVLSLITRRIRLEDVPGVLGSAAAGEVQTLVEV
jgi:threonine dehydrogenase-like Zn-dependent dehydrogenase